MVFRIIIYRVDCRPNSYKRCINHIYTFNPFFNCGPDRWTSEGEVETWTPSVTQVGFGN